VSDWLKNVATINATWAHDLRIRALHVLGLVGPGLLITVAGVGWDTTANAPVVCGATLTGYASGREQRAATMAVLNELFSWGWLLGFGFVVLPGLLLPLAASYSTSQTLWLRLAGAAPRQVAAARTVWVLGAALVLAVLGTIWAAAASLCHAVPMTGLMRPVMGMVGHLVLAAGVICVLAPVARGNRAGQVIAFAGVLLPITFFLVYAAAFSRSETELRFWWPYAAPFVYDSVVADSARHAYACILVGVGLVIGPLVVQRGDVVRLPGFVPQSEGSVCPV
jgi:hypothetical protein